MAQQEVGDSVLSNRGFVHILLRWKPFTVLVIKWALKIAMWAFFITWIAVYFLYPTEPLEGVFEKILLATGGTFFGSIGRHWQCFFLLYGIQLNRGPNCHFVCIQVVSFWFSAGQLSLLHFWQLYT